MASQLLLLLLLWGLPGVTPDCRLLLVLLHVTRGLPAAAAAAGAAWPGLHGCPPVGTGLLLASSCRSESVWAAPGARCASASSPEVGHLGIAAVRSDRLMSSPVDSWSRSSAPPGSTLQQHTQHGYVTWALAVWCHQLLARRGACQASGTRWKPVRSRPAARTQCACASQAVLQAKETLQLSILMAL